jgi:hypothetical protein
MVMQGRLREQQAECLLQVLGSECANLQWDLQTHAAGCALVKPSHLEVTSQSLVVLVLKFPALQELPEGQVWSSFS